MTPTTYLFEAGRTNPPMLHLDAVPAGAVFAGLVATSEAAKNLNGYKKALVYGRPLPAENPLNKAPAVAEPKGELDGEIIHGIIGLITESGEMADLMLTTYFGQDELDRINLKEELGDQLWYMARILKHMQTKYPDEDWSFEAIMAGNIGKLQARHGNAAGTNFNPDAVNEANRDKGAERAAIENAKNDGDSLEGRLAKLRDCKDIAVDPGNAGASEYLRGMANGIILAEAVMDKTEPVYIEAAVKEPMLGFASNKDMLNELLARTHTQGHGGQGLIETLLHDAEKGGYLNYRTTDNHTD